MKGWQFVYLPQFCAPAELPPEMIAFKQQAHRWTKGSMQTAIKLLPRILESKHLSYRIKTEAFFHLTNTLVYPLMVLLTLLMYPDVLRTPTQPAQALHRGRSSIFSASACSSSRPARPARSSSSASASSSAKKPAGRSLLYLPFLMAPGRRRLAQQRQGRLRGHLERHQAQAQRIRPHAQVRRSRQGEERLEASRRSADRQGDGRQVG